MTTTTPATEKQIDYIESLIATNRGKFFRTADSLKTMIDGYDNRHNASKHAANTLLTQAYDAIVIPSDLSDKRASTWIDALKSPLTVIERALDNDKSAAAFGLTAFISEHRAELEKALNNWY